MLVGRPTVQAVLGQKIAPGLLARYFGKKGWDSQFVDKPNDQQGDILYNTLLGDPGAHGPYTDQENGPDL